jgi:isoleucyl-tRNA synthetase
MLKPFNLHAEEEVKAFWKENNIPEQVRAKGDKHKRFYFADGPPYATGHIHMGTALNKILKDVAIRSKRMQGYSVFDRPGYDTHGLPIENKVEKELGFKTKKDIEEYGVERFVEQCRNFATRFIDTMNEEFADLGVWMDWNHPYLTLTDEYIEAIWWTFKKADEKGLLYLGSYPVHVCPRCETAVAYNEIEYEKLTDTSIYVKFPAKGEEKLFLVIWTTTPWTLPGNTGIMVHPDFDYAFCRLSNGETWIIAKAKVQELMDVLEAGYTVEKVVKGKELEGMKYENPLKKHLNLNEKELEGAYRVVLSERYVNLEEGTGLVHSAPGHGKEDWEVGQASGLPVICPVQLDGTMSEKTGKYAGKKARSVDSEIIEDLEKDGFLVYKHPYTHEYPLCWRCKTPLLMLASPQWFFRIKALREKLRAESSKVKWFPEWMKSRMDDWLQSLGDWPVSRERYWGAPLPIWICEACGKRKVIGSIEELKNHAVELPEKLDVHKPGIDKIMLRCECGAHMKRVSSVLDVWFDSGVSTWAALGFPKDDKLFNTYWPADLEIEGTDQVRGWWNSQLITSLICFDRAPFKSVVAHGMVLDIKKTKMSKSKGNIVEPAEVIKRYSRDYMRYYLVKSSRGQDIAFDWSAFKDIKRFFDIMCNAFNFGALYYNLDLNTELPKKRELRAEEQWLLSKLNSVVKKVNKAYDNFRFFEAAELIEQFVIEDFSRTYIKLIRKGINEQQRASISAVFSHVVHTVLRLIAPITPHLAEHYYQQLPHKHVSIHLEAFPQPEEEYIDPALEEEMDSTIDIVQAMLALRSEHKLRVRWPLKKVVIVGENPPSRFFGVIEKLCNVKEVEHSAEEPKGRFAEAEVGKLKAFLCIEKDAALEEEWELRELIRKVQDARKKHAFKPKETVHAKIYCEDKAFLEKHKAAIERETNTVLSIEQSPAAKMEKLIKRHFTLEFLEEE